MTKKQGPFRGFTLVELLIVVAVIGILSGVSLTVINLQQQKKVAEDAVKRSTLEKLAQGVESYATIEDGYPTGTTDASLQTYVTTWPSGISYVTDPTQSGFAIYALKSTDELNYLKYSSVWGSIQECGPTDIGEVKTCSDVVVPEVPSDPGYPGDPGDPGDPDPPSTYTLTIDNTETGTIVGTLGEVGMGAQKPIIECGMGFSTCTADVAADTKVELVVSATLPKFVFESWDGDCLDQPATCTLVMDADKKASAFYVNN